MSNLILIPAFNPDETLLKIVNDLNKSLENKNTNKSENLILIINDGSHSKLSLNILEQIKQTKNTKVLNNEINMGKGAALKKGILYAKENNFSSIVTADADGQHLVEDIINTLKTLDKKKDCYVMGVRSFNKKIPFRSKLGNILTRIIFNAIFKINIKDTQTGLRAFSSMYFSDFLTLPENKYDFELASLITASKIGNIHQIPITTIYEPGNPTSFFRPIRDSSIIYFVFIRYVGVVPLAVILELVLITNLDNVMGYSLAFLISRILSCILYFFVMRNFVFKSDSEITWQIFKFLILISINIFIIEFFIFQINIVNDLIFIMYYFIIHVILLGLNFYIQDKIIFKN